MIYPLQSILNFCLDAALLFCLLLFNSCHFFTYLTIANNFPYLIHSFKQNETLTIHFTLFEMCCLLCIVSGYESRVLLLLGIYVFTDIIVF